VQRASVVQQTGCTAAHPRLWSRRGSARLPYATSPPSRCSVIVIFRLQTLSDQQGRRWLRAHRVLPQNQIELPRVRAVRMTKVHFLGLDPRFARLWFYVDTVASCISRELLEARMRQRHIRFRKKSTPDFGAYLQTNQQGNEFSIGYYPQGSCIEAFKLEQVTNASHRTH